MIETSSDPECYVPGSVRLDADPAFAGDFVARAVGFLPRLRDWTFPQVFSPFWRLYHNFAPGHHVEHEGRRLPLGPAHFVIVPESVLFHCVGARGRPDHLYLHFNLPPGYPPTLSAPLTVAAQPAGRELARALAETLREGDSSPATTAHLAAALLHWTFARIPADVARRPSAGLQAALAYLEAHLATDVSNPALARAAGMSRRNLLRAFEAEVQASPQAYVRRRRLREAARRLAHTDETIEVIAEELGFPNRHYFTRQFTRAFACPPAKFRTQYRSTLAFPA